MHIGEKKIPGELYEINGKKYKFRYYEFNGEIEVYTNVEEFPVGSGRWIDAPGVYKVYH